MSELFDREAHADRPWTGRGYGRLRLDENHFEDLYSILSEELDRRLTALREAKEMELDRNEIQIRKFAANRVRQMRTRVFGVIQEQGWQEPV